jgi:hypothetical protein
MMFASLTDPIKIALSLTLGIVVGTATMLVTYEGIQLPLIGQVVNGRVANAVEDATAKMVTTFERDALKAQLDEERRYRATAEAASARAQERATATEIQRQAAKARIDELQARANKEGMDGWSANELEWLGRH